MKVQTYQIYFTTIDIHRKKVESLKVRSTEKFFANLVCFLANSSGVGDRGGSP